MFEIISNINGETETRVFEDPYAAADYAEVEFDLSVAEVDALFINGRTVSEDFGPDHYVRHEISMRAI